MSKSYLKRIQRLALIGAIFGLCPAAWVLLLALIHGAPAIPSRHGYEFNAFELAAIYVVGGSVAGAIVGVLFPLVKWAVGAAIVGIAAAIPMFLGIEVIIHRVTDRSVDDNWSAVIAAVLLGAPAGVMYRKMFSRRNDR